MTKSKYSICLNMIVKNEAHVIEKTLENILKYIPLTHYYISDTGSTDNTIEIINNFFNKHNIEGTVYQDEWKDFGYNRSLALKHAYNKTDYLFIFDADDRLNGNFKLPDILDADVYNLKFGSINCLYKRPLLVNNRIAWKFVGVLHEYLDTMTKNINVKHSFIEGNYYVDSGKSGDRSKDPDKYKKDAIILEKAYNKAVEENDHLKIRYSFYCAQSYRDSNQKEKSIEFYKKRVDYGDWNQEVYFSLHQIGKLYMDLKEHEKAIYYWTQSIGVDDRYECIYEIISFFRQNNKPIIAFSFYKMIQKFDINKSDKLFLFDRIYNYLLDYEMTKVCYHVKEYNTGFKHFNNLFTNNHVLNDSNTLLHISIIRDFDHYISHLNENNKDLITNYFNFIKNLYLKTKGLKVEECKIINKTINKISTIQNNKIGLTLSNNLYKNDNVNVFLSITSCKRYDLFKKTINSILFCFKDIQKIDYFLCIDDNSSGEDRKQMIKDYPFIKYQFKKQNNKGHLSSMNMIWDKLNELKPKYWIHLEDDWLFFKPDNYVTKSIEFLDKYKKDKIYQILFNKNYAEIIDHYDYVGGKYIDNNKDYLLHIKDEEGINGRNCAYWPHYSFRPSMILVEPILQLGNYDTKETFFERVYADKYFNKGYKSAFWNEITSKHIGRLTSERFDPNKKNAYQLNSIDQFENGNKKINESDINVTKFNVIKDNYIIIKNHDHFGDDINHVNIRSKFSDDKSYIDELINICEKNEDIICFNTLGYFKNDCNLETFIDLPNHGLIINYKRYNAKYGEIFKFNQEKKADE